MAVFARSAVGLRWPDGRGSPMLSPQRAQHVIVDLPGWDSLHIFNIYLHTAEGMTTRNARILCAVAEEMP
eukprot:9213640-Pyramimonas_sp.AAC.1